MMAITARSSIKVKPNETAGADVSGCGLRSRFGRFITFLTAKLRHTTSRPADAYGKHALYQDLKTRVDVGMDVPILDGVSQQVSNRLIGQSERFERRKPDRRQTEDRATGQRANAQASHAYNNAR
jgi:hypothetical protein